MLSFPQNAALILIDVQKGFDDPVWGHRNNLDAETNMTSLLHAWRQTKRPIIQANCVYIRLLGSCVALRYAIS